MSKPRVGILGGAGYTGGELVRLLLNHPEIELTFVQSRSQAGKLISEVHVDLTGQSQLRFESNIESHLSGLQVLFLALPHGESRKFLDAHSLAPDLRIIDLAHDFRLRDSSQCNERKFLYGSPELNRDKIRDAYSVANPGCFATAIELALLPLASEQILSEVYVTGITGSTGAGINLAPTSHFSFRANNIQAYKTLTHQHVDEIVELLSDASGSPAITPQLSFVPWRGDFTRGIFISAQLKLSALQIARFKPSIRAFFEKFYQNHPFVQVLNHPLDLKSVINTNQAFIEITEVGEQCVIHVALDNLLKGASGQAVQNMNLMLGFAETSGLKLKGVSF